MTKGMYNALLKMIQKTGDTALMLQFQHDMVYQQFHERKEREKLIEEIAERVLSRISATVDVSEIIDQIEELRRIIDDLGN